MRGACSTYGERKDTYKILVGKPDGKIPLIDQEDNIKTVFKERMGTRLIWLRIGSGVGSCECGNEPSGFIKCGEFLD
jgi:hypothetical protein